jgi:hypothetical protein
MGNLSMGYLFGSLLFGSIGMAALMYGKKAGLLSPMLFGVGLMAFPYLVTSTWLLYGVGAAGTGLMYRFRDWEPWA